MGTLSISKELEQFQFKNKKVLREGKRHTARRVASPWLGVGTLGYPPPSHPDLSLRGGGGRYLRLGPGRYHPSPGQTDRQTRVNTLPCRRTTYTGGKKTWICSESVNYSLLEFEYRKVNSFDFEMFQSVYLTAY